MPDEFWQIALKESAEFQIAASLLSFLYRTPGQPAFKLLRENRRHIVLATDVYEVSGRGVIRCTYLVCGEGLMVTIDFPNLPQARHFLDTGDTARAIVRANPSMTAEELMSHIQQELDAAIEAVKEIGGGYANRS